MYKIVLTGGGTAGHCQPNVNLLPYLKEKFDKIYYIGSDGMERNIVKNAGIPYYTVTTVKFVRSFCKQNFAIPHKLIKGIREAKALLYELKPNVLFSKGGYVALPVVIAAHKLGIPVISHESDYSLGLANKIAAKYSKRILTSFSDTAEKIKNGTFTGCPMRSEYKPAKREALKRFGFDGKQPVLLVIGGSLGSKAINDAVKLNFAALTDRYNILHITGEKNYDGNVNGYGYRQEKFISDMNYAYAAADVALTRAGSNVLFEITDNLLPAVVVPLPKGNSRGDQLENAAYFEKRGMIKTLFQENLNAGLICAVDEAIRFSDKYIANMRKFRQCDACRKIADILFDYASNEF